MRTITGFLVLLGACGAPPREEPRPWTRVPGEVECRRAHGPLVIDGRAEEADWARAEVVSNFSQPWLGAQDRPARAATRARLLWDDEAFYFFVECGDADLWAEIREHDGRLWFNDTFEIFLKPSREKPGYYEFHVNPAGATLDCFFPSRESGGFDRWKSVHPFEFRAAAVCDGTLNVRTDRDRGWSAEGRIAWTGFDPTGGRPRGGDLWTFALCRYDYTEGEKEPELSTCAPLGAKNFHRHEDYRPLRFVP